MSWLCCCHGSSKKRKGSKSKSRSKESSVSPTRSAEQRMSSEMAVGGANGMVGGADRDGTDGDKGLIASATAFKEMQKQRHGSSSEEDDSSSDDDSSSSSSDDDIPMPKLAPLPDITANPVALENPYAMDLMGGKELDTIIATSLKQLESARAFYESMQARVKKTD